MTPTIFEPKIIKNVCSKTYLDMFMHFVPSVELWDDEQIAEEDYDKINLTKLNLIEHGHFKNPFSYPHFLHVVLIPNVELLSLVFL